MLMHSYSWWDKSGFMSWLDQSSSGAGPCNATEGNPEVIKTIQPNPRVTFSQIRWGDIGSTFSDSTNGSSAANGTSYPTRFVPTILSSRF